MANVLPGNVDGRTSHGPTNIYYADPLGAKIIAGTINATLSHDGKNTGYERSLKAGTPMAQITATKRWVPVRLTLASGAAGTNSTSLTVDDARAFMAGDTILIGSNSATISSVNYSTNVITLAAGTTWADDAVVKGASGLAGSEICRRILAEDVELRDEDGTIRDISAGMVVAGFVKTTAILGDLAAIRASTGTKLPGILWDDDTGHKA